MSRRRRKPRAVGSAPSRVRLFTEAPSLLTWLLAPVKTPPGVESCEHLDTPGPSGWDAIDAGYVPQADRRVLCADCVTASMAVLAGAITEGRVIPGCGICGQTDRDLIPWQTPPDVHFAVAAWLCSGCSTSAGAGR